MRGSLRERVKTEFDTNLERSSCRHKVQRLVASRVDARSRSMVGQRLAFNHCDPCQGCTNAREEWPRKAPPRVAVTWDDNQLK